jgi:hypothetical protein
MLQPSINRILPIKVFRANALLGGPVWLIVWATLRPEWVVMILLFAPFVCIPLGLALLLNQEEQGRFSRRWLLLTLAQPIGATSLVASFASPAGWLAALLALPWLLVTAIVAILGLDRLTKVDLRRPEELSLAAGMIFLIIGGGWIVLSRFGARPLEFSDAIVLLTGVHFHYAGFALPLLTGLAGQTLRDRPSTVAAFGVISGVPLVALGITVGRYVPLIEAMTAMWLSAACLSVAVIQARLALHSNSVLRRSLLSLSSFSLTAGMALAGVYGIKSYLGKPWLEIDTMILWHGAINAFGFAFLGLLGWTIKGETEFVNGSSAADN